MTKMSLVNPATIRKYTFRNWVPHGLRVALIQVLFGIHPIVFACYHSLKRLQCAYNMLACSESVPKSLQCVCLLPKCLLKDYNVLAYYQSVAKSLQLACLLPLKLHKGGNTWRLSPRCHPNITMLVNKAFPKSKVDTYSPFSAINEVTKLSQTTLVLLQC